MTILKTLLRDPLCHFVVVGSVIYFLINALSPNATQSDGKVISISDQDLITLMQKRDQVFDQALYQRKYASLNQNAKQQLIKQFAEQESLYREAKKLGLDQNDEVAKRRLIQKMKYFLEGFAATQNSLSLDDIRSYYQNNIEDYVAPAQISFTHVFYQDKPANPKAAWQTAAQALAQVGEEPRPAAGDSFPYHKNYVGKTAAQVSRHFGTEFANAIMQINSSDNWQGPIQSAYGAHLVQISQKRPAYQAPFEEVQQRASDDANRAALAAARQQQIEKLVQQYEIDGPL